MKVYRDSAQKYWAEIEGLEKNLKELSVLRLITFVISAVVIVLLANERLAIPTFIAASLFVISFGALVKRYNIVDDLKKYKTFLKEIDEGEILRQENSLSGFPTGETYTNPRHHYFSDLDIFGQHSLFQLLNRTTTGSGEALLAECLAAPAPNDTILQRQVAVKELSAKVNWRQEFQAKGMKFKHSRSEYDQLLSWMEKPVRFLQHQSKYLLLIIPLSIVSTLAVIYFFVEFLFLGNILGAIPLVVMMLINSRVLRTVRPMAEEILENIERDLKILNAYRSLIMKVESEKFDSGILLRLQAATTHHNLSASAEINKLKRKLEVFQLRGRNGEFNHQFYSAFNILWFLDVYLIILTEKWKSKNGAYVREWASAISEFEVLTSLAAFHYSNPTFSFPQINDDPYCIQFKMLGHPLIDAKKRVCNDFSLNGRGEIAMITGSNIRKAGGTYRSPGWQLNPNLEATAQLNTFGTLQRTWLAAVYHTKTCR